MSAIENRLDLAEATFFLSRCALLPCGSSQHAYTECRDYESKDAALKAIVAPGFFNNLRTVADLRADDIIQIQVGRRTCEAVRFTVAVVDVPVLRESPITVAKI